MKKVFIFICLFAFGLSLPLLADPFRGRDDAMFEKSGLKQKILDAQPVAPVIIFPTSGACYNSTNITANGTAQDNTDSVEVNLDGGPWQTATGTKIWQYTFNAVMCASHTITVRAINEEGKSHEASVTFSVVNSLGSPGLAFILINTNAYSVAVGSANAVGTINLPGYNNGLLVTAIATNAFKNCGDLAAITIPNNVTSIDYCAFYNCYALISLKIPNSVISIGDGAFACCWHLTSIIIPNGVTSIGVQTFGNCWRLINVTIPNSVTSIGDAAFFTCWGLTSITIPASVTSIGNAAFFGNGLTSITISSNVSSIGVGAFGQCFNLLNITISTLNAVYKSVNGVLFNKAGTLLMQYPGGKNGSYAIPDSVTSIDDRAFYGCTRLTGLTIPDSVASISQEEFSFCNGLTGITIPNSVTSIGNYAFGNCSGLTNVTMLNATPPTLGSGFFDYTNPSLQIHVPSAGAVATYQAAPNWNTYSTNIVYP